MADLARLTFMYEHFAEICGSGTGMLWKRMLQGNLTLGRQGCYHWVTPVKTARL